MLKLYKYKRIFIISLTYLMTTELLPTELEDILAGDLAVTSNKPISSSKTKNSESNYINNNQNNQIFNKKPIDYSSFKKENISNLNKRKRDKETDITEKEQPKSSKSKKVSEQKAQKKPFSKDTIKPIQNNKRFTQINNEEQNSEGDDETVEDLGNLSMYWTPESEELLKVLNKEEYSSEQIVEKINNNFNMNCTTDDVKHKCLSIESTNKKSTQPTDEMLETFIKDQKSKGDGFKKISEKIQSNFKVVVSERQVRKKCIKIGIHVVKKQVEWTRAMRKYLTTERKKRISFDIISQGINKKFNVKTTGWIVRSEYKVIQDKN